MLKNGLDSSFIDRVVWSSVWIIAIAGVFYLAYKPYIPDAVIGGFLAGSLCSVGNMYFLKTTITSFFRPDKARWLPGLASMAALHGTLALFIYAVWLKTFNIAALLGGFTLCFVVIFLKAVSLSLSEKYVNKEQ